MVFEKGHKFSNHPNCKKHQFDGTNPPWLGKHRSDATKKKLSEIEKGFHTSPRTEFKKGMIPWNKGRKGYKMPKSSKTKQERQTTKKLWQNPEYREKVIKAQLKGLFETRPTSLEKQFIEIIERNCLPFAYSGDGRILIGYKNPDFYETNGKKICIEVANNVKRHHPDGYAEKRIEHFAKYGWKCLVFVGDKKGLIDSEEFILNKIKEVVA